MPTTKRREITTPGYADDVTALLSSAHARVEGRFIESGTVLMSIIDVLGRLIAALDALTNSLDDETATRTASDLRRTIADLTRLPEFEAERRTSVERLANASNAMTSIVADMHESMRYLRTFAVTMKIAGAGLPDFLVFAEEIRERIQSGTAEVTRFGNQLAEMDRLLSQARGSSGNITAEYAETLPVITRDLGANVGEIETHRASLLAKARLVKQLATGVQQKVAAVLSASQIGDITRQRLEHIQSSFTLYDDFVSNGPGVALDGSGRDRLLNVLHHLAASQMEDINANFQRECRSIVAIIGSFVDDTREILSLRDEMLAGKGANGHNVLQTLGKRVEAASELMGRVKEASSDADRMAHQILETTTTLLAGIDLIRTVKTDIHYMALNTNLRCSSLGEEGRSINVVTGELRVFAGRLETSTDSVLDQVQTIERAARSLAGTDGAPDTAKLDTPLLDVVATINAAGRDMDARLSDLGSQGQEVFNKVSASVTKLDFENELGDVLAACQETFEDLAGGSSAQIDDIAELADTLGRQIFATYTMAQERGVHQRYLNPDLVETVASVESDDDLFDSALF